MEKGKVWLWSIVGAGIIVLCANSIGNKPVDKVWTPISLVVVMCFGTLIPREIKVRAFWAGITAFSGWAAFSQNWLNEHGQYTTPFFFFAIVALLFFLFWEVLFSVRSKTD